MALWWQLAVGPLLLAAAGLAHALPLLAPVRAARLGAALAAGRLRWPPAARVPASRWAMPASALLAGAWHASLAGGMVCAVLGMRSGGGAAAAAAAHQLLLLRCGVAAAGAALAAASTAAVLPLLRVPSRTEEEELLRAVGLLRAPLAAHGALALAVALLLRRCRCA